MIAGDQLGMGTSGASYYILIVFEITLIEVHGDRTTGKFHTALNLNQPKQKPSSTRIVELI
jgi:hypothetical protein